MDTTELMKKAKEASNFSYSPYSHFRVGAALLCTDGTVIRGANIENRSYGLTNCAERSALFTALSAGKSEFKGLAIYSPDADYPIPPCGACRQVISEFVDKNFPIYLAGLNTEIVVHKMEEFLPFDSLHELSGSA
jgi:cytidine deaminase